MAIKYSVSEIYEELLKKISNEINEASNDKNKLLRIIDKYNLFEEENVSYYYDMLNTKILIVGDLSFSVDILYKIARNEFGIEKKQIDVLDYQQAKNYIISH